MVVIDTLASFSLTPILDDFIENIKPSPINEIQGLTHQTNEVGGALVQWKVRDIFDQTTSIKTKAYCVPETHICLFSPQTYFQKNHNQGNCSVKGKN